MISALLPIWILSSVEAASIADANATSTRTSSDHMAASIHPHHYSYHPEGYQRPTSYPLHPYNPQGYKATSSYTTKYHEEPYSYTTKHSYPTKGYDSYTTKGYDTTSPYTTKDYTTEAYHTKSYTTKAPSSYTSKSYYSSSTYPAYESTTDYPTYETSSTYPTYESPSYYPSYQPASYYSNYDVPSYYPSYEAPNYYSGCYCDSSSNNQVYHSFKDSSSYSAPDSSAPSHYSELLYSSTPLYEIPVYYPVKDQTYESRPVHYYDRRDSSHVQETSAYESSVPKDAGHS